MSLLPLNQTAALDISPAPGDYAVKLLRDLGFNGFPFSTNRASHPATRMVDSGFLALTGDGLGDPVICPVPLASCADDALTVFRALTGVPVLRGIEGAELLTERAAVMGLARNGDQSTTGHCRLLATWDGTIGLNLARESDWELLPAWIECAVERGDWSSLAAHLATVPSGAILGRGRELGLALADATIIPDALSHWMRTTSFAAAPLALRRRRPRVIDLSSLWAGPLCSRLWQAAGAEVVKVESTQRPDGARSGSAAFFERLNGGKVCVSLDLHTPEGQQALRELILGQIWFWRLPVQGPCARLASLPRTCSPSGPG
ncbi:hypothetical protein FV139_08265 [Parahaliea maris]|uniref:CoA transferase n=1 Tax=Parahaliea maris TaxID=2716870 RepID=A0A5C9A4I8_9GAMM|nr:CoA transferase [Parahaliea maris]TXS95843.1 hypothetical protein FV139_08265 [Parahaliea maris]